MFSDEDIISPVSTTPKYPLSHSKSDPIEASFKRSSIEASCDSCQLIKYA